MTEDPAVTAGRRAAAYWNIDGLPELYMGVIWVFAALVCMAGGKHKWLAIGGTFAWMAATLFGQRVISGFKNRITYPRTGYVALAKPKAKLWWFPVCVLACLAVLPFGPQQLVLPVTGIVGASIAVAVAATNGVRRLYYLGALFLLLGAGLGLANFELNTGFAVLFGMAGVASIISGGLTFRRYLRHA